MAKPRKILFKPGGLKRDQLNMSAVGAGEVEQVGRVAGKDVVAVLGEADHGGVDGVGGARPREEDARPSAKPVARGLDRATIDQRNEQTYDGLLIPDRD
jgi:hypothetical protein